MKKGIEKYLVGYDTVLPSRAGANARLLNGKNRVIIIDEYVIEICLFEHTAIKNFMGKGYDTVLPSRATLS